MSDARRIVFVDTSVVCNLLRVPGRSQDAQQVQREFEQRAARGDQFILPLTSLIETGNHVAQAEGDRRAAAERYARMIEGVLTNRAPWRLNRVDVDDAYLRAMIDGDSTGQLLVDLLHQRLGAGDLAVLVERDRFVDRSSHKRADVEVWSLDDGLRAHG